MDTVEVKILQYTFRFRRMTWREETALRFEMGDNRLRIILTHALVEVSGLKIGTLEEATKVLRPLPDAVIQRVFVLYKGSADLPRRFSTMGLYKAPEPGKVAVRMAEVEEKREKIMDKLEAEMEAKFGRQELEEAKKAEMQMLKNSKMRGATRTTPDEKLFGATPPIKRGPLKDN